MASSVTVPRKPRAGVSQFLQTLSAFKLYGQSLSLGVDGHPAITTLPENQNALMFNTGVRSKPLANNNSALDQATLTNLVPLRERDITDNGLITPIPYGETVASGAAGRFLSELGGASVFFSAHGISGVPIEQLSQGTTAYNNGLIESRRLKQLAPAELVPLLRGVLWNHGEANKDDGAGIYYQKLANLIANYNADQSLEYGQTVTPHWFITQSSSFTSYIQLVLTPYPELDKIALANDTSHVHLVTPQYIFDHFTGPNFPFGLDTLHLTNSSYKRLGEYYGLAMAETLIHGRQWRPLQPVRVENVGAASLDVVFSGADGGLVFDTDLVSESPGLGFTLNVSGVDTPALSAEVIATDTVRVSGPVPLVDFELRYALNVPPPSPPGPDTGPRGNLRAVSAPASIYGYPNLYKWCVHFAIPVSV